MDVESMTDLFEVEVRPDNRVAKRKRASKACLGCRARKVRCNVIEHGAPCTNCQLDSFDCIIGGRKRARRRWSLNFQQNPKQGLSFQVETPAPHESPSQPDPSNDGAYVQGHHTAVDEATRPKSPESIDIDHVIYQPSSVGEISNLETASANPILPSYIRPLPSRMSKDDIEYLERKGALAIPEADLRNALLQSFVEYVYGYMPLLDLREFLEIIEQGDAQKGQISLLLFQATMFAGSAFVDLKHLKAAGYQNRMSARNVLFQKARLLYDFDAETCSISLIQSLLLMTYWFMQFDDQKDLWYWMGVVTSLARTIGLQENPETGFANPKEQRLRKRIWWSIFMRDQIIALGMRRPPRIKNDDHDVPVLVLDDFEYEVIPMETTGLPMSCTLAHDTFQRRQLAAMCIENTKLCICISDVLSLQYTTSINASSGIMMLSPTKLYHADQRIRICSQKLETWISRLPKIFAYDSGSSLSGCESNVMIVHKAILKMIYLTTLAAVYSPAALPFSPWSTSTSPLPPTATDLQDSSRKRARKAATGIAGIAQDLQRLNLVRYLPTMSVTALLPAMRIHLLDIGITPDEVLTPSIRHFHDCLSVMRKLRETYASAEFATNFLEATVREAGIQVTRLPPFDRVGLNFISSDSFLDELQNSTNKSNNNCDQHFTSIKSASFNGGGDSMLGTELACDGVSIYSFQPLHTMHHDEDFNILDLPHFMDRNAQDSPEDMFPDSAQRQAVFSFDFDDENTYNDTDFHSSEPQLLPRKIGDNASDHLQDMEQYLGNLDLPHSDEFGEGDGLAFLALNTPMGLAHPT